MLVAELIHYLSMVSPTDEVRITCEGGCVLGDISDIFIGNDGRVYLGDTPPGNAKIAIFENDGKPSYRKEQFPKLLPGGDHAHP